MIALALAVLSGSLCLQLSPQLPALPLCALLLLCALILAYWPRSRLISAYLIGFLWAALLAGGRLSADLPVALERQDLPVQGAISSLPEVDGRATRFLFTLAAAPNDPGWRRKSRTVRLSWYDAPTLQAGQGWQLNLRLKRRHGFHNPGGFDYEGWLLQHSISATGYVRNQESNQAWPSANADDPLILLRNHVDQRLHTALAGVAQPGLLRALMIGAADGIPADQWDVFRATGTSHLVAISGMHISLVAGLGFALMRKLWSRSQTLTSWFAAPRAAAVAAMVLATLYAVIAGFGIPTRRAWIMVLVLLSGILLGRPTRPAHSLALAALAVLVFDPFAVLSPGFWLSFVAVTIIFMRLLPRHIEQPNLMQRMGFATRQLIHLQWALSLGLLPLTLLLFGQWGWVAPFANLLAVPWTTLLMMPLVFAGLALVYCLPSLAHALFLAAGWSAELMDAGLRALAVLPGTRLGMPSVPVGVTALACAGVALLLLPRGTPQRGLGWLALLPLLTATPARPETGTAWFTLLDVGQGLSAVIQTRAHTLVFDAGPRFSADFDAGAAVVIPFLSARGIRHVDTLIVSHADNDHLGGAASVDARAPAFKVLSSVPQAIDWRYSQRCVAGQEWRWEGVQFRILHPSATPSTNTENNNSCVLQIEAANGERLLLPGDIEAAAERELIATYGDRLQSQILVAPHHGSRTSSTAAFIAAVAPADVLIPAGYRNRYHFPHPTVSARYQQFGVRQWQTGLSGALQLRLGDATTPPLPLPERLRSRHYWHTRVTVPPAQ